MISQLYLGAAAAVAAAAAGWCCRLRMTWTSAVSQMMSDCHSAKGG
jgi:hypothetical protein